MDDRRDSKPEMRKGFEVSGWETYDSEILFRKIFENANDAIYLWELDDTGMPSRCVEVNDVAVRMLGYSKEEFLKMTPKDFCRADALGNMQGIVREIQERGHATFEIEHVRKDGGLVPVEVSSTTYAVGARKVTQSIVRDITERKAAEEAVRMAKEGLELQVEMRTRELYLSRERYRQLFNSGDDAVLVHGMLADGLGKFIEVNDIACDLYEYSREELLEMSPLDIDDHESTTDAPEIIKRLMSDHHALFEQVHVTKGGKRIPVEINSHLFELDGQLAVLSICRDITERKRAEEALRRSREYVRNIIDNVDEGLLVIDPEFRILTANKAYCESVLKPCREVIGKHCYEVSHKSDRPCYEEGEECAVRRTFETGEPSVAVHRHEDHEGNWLFFETKSFPLFDDSGEVARVIETINNVNDKYLLEEQQLKAQKLEAIGTLAGGIAHDFNNLLQGVFGNVSLAKMELSQSEDAFTMLEDAEKALGMATNLTTQLLTFSKGGKPVKKTISLPSIIEKSVKFSLSGSQIDYTINIEDEIWMVEADEGQIGQVIQNVVINAKEAIPEEGKITVIVRNVDQNEHPALGKGKHVGIIVHDNGTGITERDLPRIFDPYFSTKDSGSGLGLATSHSIINNHDGVIDVKSQLDKGSEFHIYLPAVKGVAEGATGDLQISHPEWRGRVLLMDDEELVRVVAEKMLSALGHEVELAENGEAAVRKYIEARDSGNPFDVTILDLTVRGGMGGEWTIRRLIELDPETRVIVSSGYSEESVLSNFKVHGFKDCLTKPYDIDDLRIKLNALLA